MIKLYFFYCAYESMAASCWSTETYNKQHWGITAKTRSALLLGVQSSRRGGRLLPSNFVLGICHWMGRMFTAGLRIKKVSFLSESGSYVFAGFWGEKTLVSRKLVMEKFAIEKWINMVSIIGHKVGAGAHYLDS